jgi:hypothetical protein
VRQTLRPHPDAICFAATGIKVEFARLRASTLMLSYVLTGKISDIRTPPVTTAARTEELWQHTCFEAFVRALPSTAYYKFNFAPSTQWAAYRFSRYRSEMHVVAEINTPPIEVLSSPGRYMLRATLDLNRLSDLPRDALWRLGLSALIEEMDSRKSYWALSHPPGKPDFHHCDCFSFQIFPAGRQ